VSNISVDFDVLNQRGSPAWFTDTFANIPTAGFVGRMFISKDTFAFYRDTGSGWDLIGGPGTGTLTGSGVSGQVSFFNGTQTITGNNNLFWDNTNGRLGIGTATPGASLDIHSTGTNAQFNGTGTNNAYLVFQNAGTSKWRIGNTYNAGANSFDIYIPSTNTTPLSISSIGTITLTANVNTTGQQYVGNGLYITYVNGGSFAGYTNIWGRTDGLNFALGNTTGGASFIFQTAAIYNYTFPATTGTLALTSDITSAISGTTNTLAKFTSANVIGNSGVSDDGTNLTYTSTAKATLLVKAANNTFYGQLAFTNGSNALYGGISYNNSGQYMQFETNTSEWARLLANGNLGIGTTSPSYRFEVSNSGAGVSVGDFYVDTANNSVYVGRQSSTSGDNSKFYVRNRVNTLTALSVDPGGVGSVDVVGTFSTTRGTNLATATGNVLIATTTDIGEKLQVNGGITTSYIRTTKGSTSIPYPGFTTLISFGASFFAIYQVYAYLQSSGGGYTAFCTLIQNNTALVVANSYSGGLVTFSVSGLNLQVSQGSGVTQDISYVYLKIE